MKSSKNNPLVSVIIPTKNNIRTIEKCLQSVKDQTYKNIELIVVDNHSTDGTFEVAKRFTNKVYTKGPERSVQRNFGASKSAGKYLLIHDSDIYFNKSTVAECVDLCHKESADAVIVPEVSIGRGNFIKAKRLERSFYSGNNYLESPRFFTSTVFTKYHGYDSEMTGPEDWDIMIRMREGGAKILRTRVSVMHDEGTVNLMGSAAKKIYYSQNFEKYKALHPDWFKAQSNPFVRFPLKRLLLSLLKNPLVTLSMLVMKTVEYLATKKYV